MGEAMSAEANHFPARPGWGCTGCDQPWPCATRKVELLAESSETGISLRYVMAEHMFQAAADFGAEQPADLVDRFVGWLPSPARPTLPPIADGSFAARKDRVGAVGGRGDMLPGTQVAGPTAGHVGISYCPSDTKFWFIWTDRGIRVQYGTDLPSVAVLPAPAAIPHAPPFAPSVTAFREACEAWLGDDAAVADAVLKALQGQPDPATVAALKAFAEGRMPG